MARSQRSDSRQPRWAALARAEAAKATPAEHGGLRLSARSRGVEHRQRPLVVGRCTPMGCSARARPVLGDARLQAQCRLQLGDRSLSLGRSPARMQQQRRNAPVDQGVEPEETPGLAPPDQSDHRPQSVLAIGGPCTLVGGRRDVLAPSECLQLRRPSLDLDSQLGKGPGAGVRDQGRSIPRLLRCGVDGEDRNGDFAHGRRTAHASTSPSARSRQ